MSSTDTIVQESYEAQSPVRSRRQGWRIVLLSLIALVLTATAALYYFFGEAFSVAVESKGKPVVFCIPSNASHERALDTLVAQGVVKNKQKLSRVARKMGWYDKSPRSGRFTVEPRTSYRGLVNIMQNAKQTPVRWVINNKRSRYQVAATLGAVLEADSAAFARLLNDTVALAKAGYTPDNILTVVIPNTYDLYWNLSPAEWLERMKKEHQRFWNQERLEKAKQLGLTPTEVSILASIVQGETRVDAEKSRIAGVYLNRLRTPGWKLEADPTVAFATGDYALTNRSLYSFDSPYNTYRYAGLPPGPINMPDIVTIDKTLAAETHRYFFFCANTDGSGSHLFSETFEQHQVYARRYREWRAARERANKQ